ncbi:MAG: xanthine dehydrogenase family protein [Deltaproteobacteria bacterium]|nr:xanthine dehydrogenase family protein [Deltaproteobacteria bacterium]
MIWGKALRSPLPHARILRIDTSKARALPGVLAVITAEDIPDVLIGRSIYDMPVLAKDRVRFVGEKVAAVAAEDREAAEEAVGLIEVDYEELPAVFDPLEAMQPGAPILHENFRSYQHLPPDAPDIPNVVSHLGYNLGDTEEGFRQARHIFEHTFRTQWMHQGYLEPHATVVSLEEPGRVHVWASNKMPFRLKELLADCLLIPQEQMVIHLLPIGGDFGGKGAVMDTPLCYHLSRLTGRPVKMVMSYTEELMAANPRHPAIITLKTGVSREGKLVARQASAIFNSGAYGAFKPIPNVSIVGAAKAQGCYYIPHLKIDSYCVYTNCVPCGHARAPGDPQLIFAVESQMDMMAAELGIDPLEFRMRNLLRDGDRLPQGTPLEQVRIRETLEAAVKAAGWGLPKPRPNIGRGIGIAHRHIGIGDANAEMELEENGKILLTTTIPDTGTGAHTIMRQIACETLGVSLERLQVKIGNTDQFRTEAGAGASRVTHVAGRATLQAAQKLKDLLLKEASSALGKASEELELRGGRVQIRGDSTSGLDLSALAARARSQGQPLKSSFYLNAETHGTVTSFCAQVAEVEVSPETGQVKVLKITCAHDAGTVINPLGHQGQIEGGIMHGLGFTLIEEIQGAEGRLSTLSLGDYKLPNIKDIPKLRTVVLTEAGGPVPFGGKSVGEGTTSPVPGAIANAIYDAVGVRIMETPITAEKIYSALRQRRAQE